MRPVTDGDCCGATVDGGADATAHNFITDEEPVKHFGVGISAIKRNATRRR